MMPWTKYSRRKQELRNFLFVRRLSTSSVCSDRHRNRLSSFWMPTGGITLGEQDDSVAKLVQAGILRQTHSGIYHLLPLGKRIQNRLECLVDKHLTPLGSSKVDLSSISSETLWTKSGRLDSTRSELFRFQDKQGGKYLLSPTHEEEITELVAKTVHSYKDLPLRLYQISRKYRDEIRPRHGLLRSREFVMCDMYTFDYGVSQALETYEKVRQAFTRFFADLRIPFLVAEADSGNMGGSLSHEFHVPASNGDDRIITCDVCGYVANQEVAETTAKHSTTKKAIVQPAENMASTMEEAAGRDGHPQLFVWRNISQDRQSLINVWYSLPAARAATRTTKHVQHTDINIHALRAVVPTIDASVPDFQRYWASASRPGSGDAALPEKIINVFDFRVSRAYRDLIRTDSCEIPIWPMGVMGSPPKNIKIIEAEKEITGGYLLDLLRIKDGDSCPRCYVGSVVVQKAIELGHTFHLGTRYSEPLGAQVCVPRDRLAPKHGIHQHASKLGPDERVHLQMGCHGIGISRMIGAIASILADERGLNWPRLVAPFEVVIIPGKGLEDQAGKVYDTLRREGCQSNYLPPELVIDDRPSTLPWKLKDADLIGFPVIIVIGRGWTESRMCEIQCRRLKLVRNVPLHTLASEISLLLKKL